MQFQEIIGHTDIKARLVRTVKENRISHAQLFLGPSGTGKLAMAIAYAQYINCTDKQDQDSCGVCASCVKFEKLAHPDLHFLYPTAANKKIDKPVSLDFIKEWRALLEEKKQYINLNNWYEKISIERKQAIINVRDCSKLLQTLAYRNYEADYKVMIIWMVEKLFHAAAPRILKILEEPPDHTLFVLIAEDTEPILPTILSRTQIIRFPPIDDESLLAYHMGQGVEPQVARDVIRVFPGDLIRTTRAIQSTGEEDENFKLFRQWMRLCYQRKIEDTIRFVAELSKHSREYQKSLMAYCLRMIRETFLMNRQQEGLTRLNSKEQEMVKGFAQFVHEQNINLFYREFNDAIYHIERNVNGNVLYLDMSLKFMRYLRGNFK
jgi:DNA polymerase-3 subunit delta'